MIITVIGNCQAAVLSSWLRLMAPGADIQLIPGLQIAGSTEEEKNAWLAQLDAADLALVQDEEVRIYGPLATSKLAARRSIIRFPGIYFDGFHPDCHYIPLGGGKHVRGFMGDYQSVIAAAAFLEGLPVARAANLFNTYVYAALGYFAIWDASLAALNARFVKTGLDAGYLRGLGAFVNTVNHPTPALLKGIAEQLLDKLQIPRIEPDAQLAQAVGPEMSRPVWPVYPEIRRALALDESDFGFKNGNGVLNVSQFVTESYKHFSQAGPFTTPKIEAARAFIRAEVRR